MLPIIDINKRVEFATEISTKICILRYLYCSIFLKGPAQNGEYLYLKAIFGPRWVTSFKYKILFGQIG